MYVQGILNVRELEYDLLNSIKLYRMFGPFLKYKHGISNSLCRSKIRSNPEKNKGLTFESKF